MNNPIIIAIDAMGGENSPNKVIEGISIHAKNSNNVSYKIFGDERLIIPYIDKFKIHKSKIADAERDRTNRIDESRRIIAKKLKEEEKNRRLKEEQERKEKADENRKIQMEEVIKAKEIERENLKKIEERKLGQSPEQKNPEQEKNNQS